MTVMRRLLALALACAGMLLPAGAAFGDHRACVWPDTSTADAETSTADEVVIEKAHEVVMETGDAVVPETGEPDVCYVVEDGGTFGGTVDGTGGSVGATGGGVVPAGRIDAGAGAAATGSMPIPAGAAMASALLASAGLRRLRRRR